MRGETAAVQGFSRTEPIIWYDEYYSYMHSNNTISVVYCELAWFDLQEINWNSYWTAAGTLEELLKADLGKPLHSLVSVSVF